MNGARATLRDAATELRPRQAYDVAQYPQERHVRGNIRGMRLAIDLQGNHRLSPPNSHSSTCALGTARDWTPEHFAPRRQCSSSAVPWTALASAHSVTSSHNPGSPAVLQPS